MATSNLIGQPVISKGNDFPMIYAGPSDRPGWTRIKIAIGRPGESELSADFDSVAPADIEIPASSERIEIIKHDKKPYPWASGKWQLLIDGEHCGWHRIKRDAQAEGLRSVAIIEWHERMDAHTEAYMNGHGLDVNDSEAWEASRDDVIALVLDGVWNPGNPEAGK